MSYLTRNTLRTKKNLRVFLRQFFVFYNETKFGINILNDNLHRFYKCETMMMKCNRNENFKNDYVLKNLFKQKITN